MLSNLSLAREEAGKRETRAGQVVQTEGSGTTWELPEGYVGRRQEGRSAGFNSERKLLIQVSS